MNQQLEEQKHYLEVPDNVGVRGFLQLLEKILRLPRVQRIEITPESVAYTRYSAEGDGVEDVNADNVDLTSLSPYYIIRNSPSVEEYTFPAGVNAAVVIAGMLDHVSSANFVPIAFVVGANSSLSTWYFYSTESELRSQDRLFGYRLYRDRGLTDTSLVLCASTGVTQDLIHTRMALKVEIPRMDALDEEVRIV